MAWGPRLPRCSKGGGQAQHASACGHPRRHWNYIVPRGARYCGSPGTASWRRKPCRSRRRRSSPAHPERAESGRGRRAIKLLPCTALHCTAQQMQHAQQARRTQGMRAASRGSWQALAPALQRPRAHLRRVERHKRGVQHLAHAHQAVGDAHAQQGGAEADAKELCACSGPGGGGGGAQAVRTPKATPTRGRTGPALCLSGFAPTLVCRTPAACAAVRQLRTPWSALTVAHDGADALANGEGRVSRGHLWESKSGKVGARGAAPAAAAAAAAAPSGTRCRGSQRKSCPEG